MAGLSTKGAPRAIGELGLKERALRSAPLYAQGVPTSEDIEGLRYVLGLGMVSGDWEIKRALVSRLSESDDWELDAYRSRACGLVKHFASLTSEDLGEKLVRHRRRILEALVTIDLLGLEARPAWREDLLKVAAFDVLEDEDDDLETELEFVSDGLVQAAASLEELTAHLEEITADTECREDSIAKAVGQGMV